MNEFATIIGWIVIIGFVIYIVGSFAGSIKQQERKKAEEIICIKNSAYRIAARRIYHQTDNPDIREMVKRYANDYLNGWALLDFDLSDEVFLSTYFKLGTYEAEVEIMKRGYPLELEGGEIKQRW